MTMRHNSVVNSPDIIDILGEIQRREGRNQSSASTNHPEFDRLTIEVVPFWEAPLNVIGLIRIRSGLNRYYLNSGARCAKCPLTGPDAYKVRRCACHNDTPVQFAKVPNGWVR